MKARMNVSGDRSIDMFASEFNSVGGGNQTTQMNLMDDSTVELGAKKRDQAANMAQYSQSKGSSPGKGYHAHK